MIIYEVLRPRCEIVDVVYYFEIELIAECTKISVRSHKMYAEKELSISPPRNVLLGHHLATLQGTLLAIALEDHPQQGVF